MVTEKEYKKNPESYWRGKKVKTLCKLNNGYYEIPKGTILEIERKYQGFSLRGIEVCSHCEIGRKVHISRVNYFDVILEEN